MDGELILRFAGAFTVIALLLSAFVAVVKRGGFSSGSFLRRERLVEVIETTPLPHQGSLHVIKVGQAYLLIGRTEGSIALLGDVAADAVERVTLRPAPRTGLLERLSARPPVGGK